MKISVIIPMYNSKNTIKDAIESVINQKYNGQIEIIVINDGSTDGCEIDVEEFVNNNANIKLINKENGGVSSARNKGIREASGDWIALLDSDDIWFPEKLEKQVNEIKKNNKIKFIGSNRNGDVYPFYNKKKYKLFSLNAKEIIAKWHPHNSTALIKKEEIFKAGLYDETRNYAEDGDLWLRISQFCDLYVLNEDLVFTGNGKRSYGVTGLSANMSEMYKGEIKAIKGAKRRKQINIFEFYIFYMWLTFKYFRRIVISSYL